MPYHLVLPQRWDAARLQSDRQKAVQQFTSAREREEPEQYKLAFEASRDQVQELLRLTRDLLALDGTVFERDPRLIRPARFLAAPPISEDDLNTLVGEKVAGRKVIPPAAAGRVALVVRAACDPIRFLWLAEGRRPSPIERRTAIAWSAGLAAVESIRTLRRTEDSQRQERLVIDGLAAIGWTLAPLRRISSLDDLSRGEFCREALLARSKCDVPVRLRDGRLLALECKVSHSEINSVKRLNREVGGKADQWRAAFGQQVIPAAVLSGVFKLGNLEEAQERQGIALFWEHDLKTLFDFVRSCH